MRDFLTFHQYVIRIINVKMCLEDINTKAVFVPFPFITQFLGQKELALTRRVYIALKMHCLGQLNDLA